VPLHGPPHGGVPHPRGQPRLRGAFGCAGATRPKSRGLLSLRPVPPLAQVVTQAPSLLQSLLPAPAVPPAPAQPLAVAPTRLFRTSLPAVPDASLLEALRRGGTRVSASSGDPTADSDDLKFALRLGLLALASFFILSNDSSGVSALLRRPGRLYEGSQGAASAGATFADVAGVDEAKAELADVVDFLRTPHKYAQLGAKVPRGVLLVGAPGCGKTLLARAVAGEAGVPFFAASASEFVELFVGLGGRRVRSLFAEARKKAPCILFIDELDAVGRSRAGGSSGAGVAGVANEEREQTLNQLLTEMDGFESGDAAAPPVIVLAATNRPDALDAALRRPGRFDRTVSVSAPDRAGRAAILRVHLGRLPLTAVGADANADAVAATTVGFSGADLANVVNEAAMLTARRGGERVSAQDLAAACERALGGVERSSMRVSPQERRTVAIHEAGHAIVGRLASEVAHSKVTKVSIVPRGVGALGWTLTSPLEDRYLASEPTLKATIAVLMAGRAAEQHALGVLTSGAADDLRRATSIATDMVASYGMCGSTVGPRSVSSPGAFASSNESRGPSPQLAARVDDAIDVLLRGAEQWAIACVAHNQGLLQELADRLEAQETIGGDELENMLARAQMPMDRAPFWARE